MIREITKDDKEIFIELEEKFYNSEAVIHPVPKDYIIRTFKEVISDSPYAKAYIIESDSNVAGYSQISLTYSSEVGGLVVLIEELFILDDFRNKGLGSEFLEFIEKEFPEAKRFRLEVEKDNEGAKRLYETKGFKKLNYLQMVKE